MPAYGVASRILSRSAVFAWFCDSVCVCVCVVLQTRWTAVLQTVMEMESVWPDIATALLASWVPNVPKVGSVLTDEPVIISYHAFFFHSFIAVKSYEKAQHAHCCWTCSSRFNIVILTSIIKKRKLIEFGLMWKLIWTPSKTCLQLNPGVVHYVNTDCKPHCNKKVEKLR